MMYLIRLSLVCCVACFSLNGCIEQLSTEEYNELCPYERKYGGWSFYLEAPLFIEPHKPSYKVGDTVNFKVLVSDDMNDLSRDEVFKIKDFPFKPSHELYRIDTSGWVTGYNGNELYIDSIYSPSLVNPSLGWSGSIRGRPTYEEGIYFMEHQVVFREPGRYVHLVRDVIETIDGHLISEGKIPEYAAVSNDSGCPEPHSYGVCYILQGDPHYDRYYTELRFLNKEVKLDKMCSFDEELDEVLSGSACRINTEWSGVFGFEVVE